MTSDSKHPEEFADPGPDTPAARGRRPVFLLVAETAAFMRLDESTLYRHLRAGRFPAVKVGGRYLVPAAVLDQLAEEALTSGTCVIVEEWATRWREQQAAKALALGQTRAPGSSGVA